MDEAAKAKAINTLKKIAVFGGLDDGEYQELLSVCKVSYFNKGETIFHENDASMDMYVLLSGEVEMHTRNSGCVYSMKPGDLFGEIGVISQKRRTASAVVGHESESALLHISKDRFDFLLGKSPVISAKIMRNVAKVLADRLLEASGPRYIL